MTKIKESANTLAKYNHKNIWLCVVEAETGSQGVKITELYRVALVL